MMNRYTYGLILHLCWLLGSSLSAQPAHRISLVGKFEGDSAPEEIRIRFYEEFFEHFETKDTLVSLAGKQFQFTADKLQHPGWLVLSHPGSKQPDRLLLVEPGDQVVANIGRQRTVFSGKGAARLQVMDSLQQIPFQKAMTSIRGPIGYETFARQEKNTDSLFHQKMAILETFRESFTNEEIKIIELTMRSERWKCSYQRFRVQWISTKKTELRNELISFYRDYYSQNKLEAAQTAVAYAAGYGDYLLEKARVDILLAPLQKDSLQYPDSYTFNDIFHNLSMKYQGLQRDRALLHAFTQVQHFSVKDSLSELLKQFSDQLTMPSWKAILFAIKSSQLKGMPAYNFQLPDKNGKLVRLADFKGKTILIDFWFTGCSACRTMAPYLKALEDSLPDREKIVFITVSVDKDKEQWKKSLAAETYSSAQNINVYTGGNGTEDPLIQHYRYTSFPELLLIDKNGNLLDAVPPRPQNESSAQILLKILKAAVNR
jgi:cytochrome oxidase Cu insertion factor (SCO1/SenC/PrrC family)